MVQRKRVRLTYRGWDREPSERLVDPWGLVEKNDVWYLLGGTNGARRTYRVDRIVEATVTDEPAERPADFDLAEAWASVVQDVNQQRGRAVAIILVDREIVPWLRTLFGQQGVTELVEAALSDAVSSDAALSEAVSSEAVSSEAVSSDAVSSEAVSSDAVSSEAVSSDAASSEAVSSDAASSEAVSSEAVSSHAVVGGPVADRRVLLRVTAPTELMLARGLAGWGNQVDVQEPESLRVELRRIGLELVQWYEQSAR